MSRNDFDKNSDGQMEMAIATSAMIKHSGEIIITSGSILVVTWMGLAFFPVYGLDAVGYCSALTVFLCLAINLILTPALLMLLSNCCIKKNVVSFKDAFKEIVDLLMNHKIHSVITY